MGYEGCYYKSVSLVINLTCISQTIPLQYEGFFLLKHLTDLKLVDVLYEHHIETNKSLDTVSAFPPYSCLCRPVNAFCKPRNMNNMRAKSFHYLFIAAIF